MTLVFTVIGDLVGSRAAGKRGVVQEALIAALDRSARVVAPVDRLEPTVGDEFQGVYPTFAAAALSGLLVRLRLAGVVDVRCGIGAGEREVFARDRRPMLQDGPAWWSARAAIDELARPSNRLRRSWYDGSRAAGAGPPVELANAFLTTRDALVDRLNERSRSMLLLALEGRSQREIAEAEGISTSAVSQAFARGVGAVRDAQRMLTELAASPTGDTNR